MIDILILLFINSALCFGFWNACNYQPSITIVSDEFGRCFEDTEEVKGVLWFIDKWSSKYWFYKPLCGCLPCMASFHSIYPYWSSMYFTNNINLEMLAFYPIYILALSGINYLINEIL